MKKLINKLESATGIDIDGDGRVGGRPPQQASFGQPVYGGQPYGGQAYPPPGGQAYGGQAYPPSYGGQPSYGGAPGYPPMGQPVGQQYPPQNAYPPSGGSSYPPQSYPGAGYPVQQPPLPQPHYSGGTKKALLIGINYFGQQGELRGCVNDVKTMKNFLSANGFTDQNTRILVDDPSWRTEQPTYRNILSAFQWLASSARPGDCLFFHYSGHGGQLPDDNGDEASGYDQTLVPVDFRSAGQIRDDLIFQYLVQPLPQGCRLTAVCDCCHSGTIMDLPYVFVANKNTMSMCFRNGQFNPASIPQMLLSQGFNKKAIKKQIFKLGQELLFGGGRPMGGGGGGGGQSGYSQQGGKTCNAEVIMFSGCADNQTSADVSNVASFNVPGGSGAGGACTNAFISTLASQPGLSLIELLEKMRIQLEQKGYKQVPQLSSSRPLPMGEPFTLQLLRH